MFPPYDAAVLSLGIYLTVKMKIYLHKSIFVSVQSSIIYDSQKLYITPLSLSWMKNMVHLYSEILLSIKNQLTIDIYNMNDSD